MLNNNVKDWMIEVILFQSEGALNTMYSPAFFSHDILQPCDEGPLYMLSVLMVNVYMKRQHCSELCSSSNMVLLAGSVAAGLFNISHFQGRPAPTAYITQETDVGNTQSSLPLPPSLSPSPPLSLSFPLCCCPLSYPFLSFTHTTICP